MEVMKVFEEVIAEFQQQRELQHQASLELANSAMRELVAMMQHITSQATNLAAPSRGAMSASTPMVDDAKDDENNGLGTGTEPEEDGETVSDDAEEDGWETVSQEDELESDSNSGEDGESEEDGWKTVTESANENIESGQMDEATRRRMMQVIFGRYINVTEQLNMIPRPVLNASARCFLPETAREELERAQIALRQLGGCGGFKRALNLLAKIFVTKEDREKRRRYYQSRSVGEYMEHGESRARTREMKMGQVVAPRSETRGESVQQVKVASARKCNGAKKSQERKQLGADVTVRSEWQGTKYEERKRLGTGTKVTVRSEWQVTKSGTRGHRVQHETVASVRKHNGARRMTEWRKRQSLIAAQAGPRARRSAALDKVSGVRPHDGARGRSAFRARCAKRAKGCVRRTRGRQGGSCGDTLQWAEGGPSSLSTTHTPREGIG